MIQQKGVVSTSFHKHCPTLALEHAGISVYAASKYDITSFDDFDLVLNLTGYRIAALSNSLVEGVLPWTELNVHAKKFNTVEVRVDWDDGGVLDVPKAFWQHFLKLCEDTHVKRICVCCMGGHGRTGTTIAILRVLMLNEAPELAIATVRSTVCQECVETLYQERYVHYIATGEWPEIQHKTWAEVEDAAAAAVDTSGADMTTRYFCTVCRRVVPKIVRLGGRVFCIDCVKEEVEKCTVTGDGKAAAIKAALECRADFAGNGIRLEHSARVQKKGTKKGTDKGVGVSGRCEYCNAFLKHEGIEDSFGYNICNKCAGQGTKAQECGDAESMMCSVCREITNVLIAIAVEGVNEMVCRDCKRVWDSLGESRR